MRGIFRSLPGLIGAFVLGLYYEDPTTAQATSSVKDATYIAILAATVIACLFVCAITRRKKDSNQQSGGFGYAPRTRTGRN